MTSRNDKSTENPGPVPPPAPYRRASFSQNPSFSTLFGTTRGSPPRAAPDPSLSRRFSWSYPPPKESSSAIDDSDEIVTSPSDDHRASEFGLGRRLSTATSSIKEALGFKADEPSSPRAMKANPFQQARKSSVDSTNMPSPGTSPTSSEGGDYAAPGQASTQSFMQRRRASFGRARNEGADPHADRMLQGHFSID